MNASSDFNHSPDPPLAGLLDQALAGPQPPPDLADRIAQTTTVYLPARSQPSSWLRIWSKTRRSLAVAALLTLATLAWLTLDSSVRGPAVLQSTATPYPRPSQNSHQAHGELTSHLLWTELQELEAALNQTFQDLEQDMII